MQKITLSSCLNWIVPVVLLCTLTLSPDSARAVNEPIGQAQAVNANVLGVTTLLADSGTLNNAIDTRHNSLPEGSVTSSTLGKVLTADVLHATSTSDTDQVDSTASLTDLVVSVTTDSGLLGLGDTITVSAEFVRSEARAASTGVSGDAMIDNLSINGTLTNVTGEVNQVVDLIGGKVVINEHQSIPGGVRVTALRIVVDGVADLVIAPSTAGLPQ